MRRSRKAPEQAEQRPRRRRWPRRLLVLAALAGAAFAYRGRKLEQADRRHPTPPRQV